MKQYFEEKRIRPDILTAAVYWAIIIMMVYTICGLRIYGDKGAGFLSGPLSVFYILYLIFVLAVQKSVWVMVRVRARRSQFLNAEANMKRSFRIFIISGIVVMAMLLIGSFFFSEKLFGSSRGNFACIMVGITSIVLCIQGVLRGYLQGIGYTKPIVISDLIIAVISFVSGIFLSLIMYRYGLKVNDLFHISELSAVYGSAGMLLGILIGSLGGLLQILISFTIRKAEIEEIVKEGAPRYLDNKNDVLTSIRSIVLLYVSPALLVLVDQIFFVITHKKAEAELDFQTLMGIYAGRAIPVIVTCILLCCVPFIRPWNRVMARIERDEIEGARDRLDDLASVSLKLVIPVMIFVFVMAQTLEIALFGKDVEMSSMLIRIGSPLIVFGAVAMFLSWLLNHMGKTILTTVCLALSWAVHVALLIAFTVLLKLGIYGMMLASLVSVIFYCLSSFFMLKKMLKYNFDFAKNFGKPLFAAAVAGFVIFLINKLFINLVGDILTFVICFVVFYFGYLFAMVFLGEFNRNSLKKIPFGFVYNGFVPRNSRDYYEE